MERRSAGKGLGLRLTTKSGPSKFFRQSVGQLQSQMRTTWRSTSGDDLMNLFDLMEDPGTCSIADASADTRRDPVQDAVHLDTMLGIRKGLKRSDEDSVDLYPRERHTHTLYRCHDSCALS